MGGGDCGLRGLPVQLPVDLAIKSEPGSAMTRRLHGLMGNLVMDRTRITKFAPTRMIAASVRASYICQDQWLGFSRNNNKSLPEIAYIFLCLQLNVSANQANHATTIRRQHVSLRPQMTRWLSRMLKR